MKKLFAILAFATLAQASSFEAARYFAQGSTAYTNQNYQEAVELYKRSQKEGLNSPALYYNLANACYKSGDLGSAIANYRKAELFDPRDPDCAANLSRAISQTEDSISKKEVPPALRSFFFLYFYLGLKEQMMLALAFWVVFWLALIVLILSKNESVRSAMKKFSLAFFIITLLFLGSALYKYYDAAHQGVIISEQAKVHAGPDASYTEIFILKNGSEVKVTKKEGNFVKILVRQEEGESQAGWLEASQIETIL